MKTNAPKTAANRTRIRSIGLGKINRLVKAAANLQDLQPAFAEWADGEIYVCKKTGDYRYRFGDHSKAVAPWNHIARKLFGSAEEFAFAAMIFAQKRPQGRAAQPAAPAIPAPRPTRVNVISIAAA